LDILAFIHSKTLAFITMDESATKYYTEEDSLYHPSWLDTPRDFVDLRTREAEYFNNILYAHMPHQVTQWDCCEDSGWTFEFDDLVLEIENDIFDLPKVSVTTWSMPRAYVDPLRQKLRRILSKVSDMDSTDMTSIAVMLLQLVEEAVIFIHTWKFAKATKIRSNKAWLRDKGHRGWNVQEVRSMSVFYENDLGADLDTIDESGDGILGKSIKELCKDIPENYRIVHVEPIFRKDLVRRFRRRQDEMRSELRELGYERLRRSVSGKTRKSLPAVSSADKLEAVVEELVEPFVTYHGTGSHAVSSIVRWGFVKPFEKAGNKVVEVRCGGTFGYGIYSSPSTQFALHYSRTSCGRAQKTKPEDLPGMKLIVCAVLMGRAMTVTRDEARRTNGLADPTAQSHVSPNKLEYIVFDTAQIVPCYVIHFDLGAGWARRALAEAPEDPNKWVTKTHPKLEQKELFPADIAAIAQAKKAAAAKWFPYGFGPAAGTSFVIEAIAEHDDDDEDYGEYQGRRQEVKDEMKEYEKCVKEEGGSWFDVYQKSRDFA
jgi:hypothetical protein